MNELNAPWIQYIHDYHIRKGTTVDVLVEPLFARARYDTFKRKIKLGLIKRADSLRFVDGPWFRQENDDSEVISEKVMIASSEVPLLLSNREDHGFTIQFLEKVKGRPGFAALFGLV